MTEAKLQWKQGNDGTIRQSAKDAKDPDIRLFTETVEAHNEAVKNGD